MRRDISALTSKKYDLIVVGGGAYGVCAAREAARGGLSVALIERGDFGDATTGNSLHTIHGGLRYLQHLDFRRMRESIRERRTWMKLAPDLVKPMPFVLPTYGHGLRGPEVMAAALALNDLISADRNRALSPEVRLPRGRFLSRRAASAMFKHLKISGFNGAALWYDGFNSSPERLLVKLLDDAHSFGAELANYVSASGFLIRNGSVCGVKAQDGIGGGEIELHSRCVLNAAGPWVDSIIGRLRPRSSVADDPMFRPSKAFNLVVRRIPLDYAVGIPVARRGSDRDTIFDKGSVTYFVIPWGDFSLIGTKHLSFHGEPDALRANGREINDFLDEINPGLGIWRIDERDVVAVKCGLLPEQKRATRSEDVVLQKHGRIVDHQSRDGIPGLLSVIGVKWTTARIVAEQCIRLICEKLKHRPASSWGPARQLVSAETRNAPAAGTNLVEDVRVTGEDIVFAARHEMALNLTDAIFRRTLLGLSRGLDGRVIVQCAELMRGELNWSEAETRRQVDLARAALARMNAWRT
jgi:glycerol-3-phosphate dehydrogenase